MLKNQWLCAAALAALTMIDNTTADQNISNQTFAFNFGVGFPLQGRGRPLPHRM